MSSTPVQGFTGAYRDMVTAAYPLGNGYRSYLPSLMRFAAPDSFSPFNDGGINPYVYCGTDPINRVDPSGHISFNLGLEDDVGTHAWQHMQAAGRATTQTESTSIPAAYAREWEAVHSQESSSQAWDQTRTKSAIAFQRHWRGWAARKKLIPEKLHALASSMGRKMTEADDYSALRKADRIFVSSKVEAGNPFAGHSSIYHDVELSQIVFTSRSGPGNHTTRFPLTEEMANFMNSTRNSANQVTAGVYATRDQQIAGSPAQLENVKKYVKKGRMYVLDEKYSSHYASAYDQEAQSFSTEPLSYGLQYNCHAYVYNILNRLRDLA